jgi:hypothetical protein
LAITVLPLHNASVVDRSLLAKTIIVFNSVFLVTNAQSQQTVTLLTAFLAFVPITFALVWVSVPNVVLVDLV